MIGLNAVYASFFVKDFVLLFLRLFTSGSRCVLSSSLLVVRKD